MRIKNVFTLLLLQRKYLFCMYVIYYKYSVVGHIKVYLFHMYMSYTRVPIEEDGSSVGTNDEAQICLHIIFYKYIPTSG